MNMESFQPQEKVEELPEEKVTQDTNPITKWAKRAIVAAGLTLGTLHGAEAEGVPHTVATEQVSMEITEITHAFGDVDTKESAEEFITTHVESFIHSHQIQEKTFSTDEARLLASEALHMHEYVEILADRFHGIDTSSLKKLEKLEAFFLQNK